MFTNTIVLIVLNGIFIKNTGFLEITGTQKILLSILFAPNPYSYSLSKEMKTISLQRHEIYVIVGFKQANEK